MKISSKDPQHLGLNLYAKLPTSNDYEQISKHFPPPNHLHYLIN